LIQKISILSGAKLGSQSEMVAPSCRPYDLTSTYVRRENNACVRKQRRGCIPQRESSNSPSLSWPDIERDGEIPSLDRLKIIHLRNESACIISRWECTALERRLHDAALHSFACMTMVWKNETSCTFDTLTKDCDAFWPAYEGFAMPGRDAHSSLKSHFF
jgi:hypothetical protein